MSFVRTVLGDVSPEQLGVTYSHEHIVCRPPYWGEQGEDDLLLDDPGKSKQDVQLFQQAGGQTIVDTTAVDYGRDITSVKRISEETGIHIVATAGFNKGFLWSAKRPGTEETFAEWIERSSIEELTRFVVREVTEGMEGTTVRGGQVKFGTGYNRPPLWLRAWSWLHF